jgi:hypothetical protein
MVPTPTNPTDRPRWELDEIAVALRGLQFGEVTVTVQDGVVIQIDRLERRRLRKRREVSEKSS